MADPRAALAALTAAFERHLEACAQRRGEDDPAVVAAYDDLADAFEEYDDALLEAYGEMTPLDVYAGPDEDEDDDDEDEDEDDEDDEEEDDAAEEDDDADADQRYLGLDDEDFDEIEDDGEARPN
ncbi:hypothetical protein [Nostocoides australiense]